METFSVIVGLTLIILTILGLICIFKIIVAKNRCECEAKLFRVYSYINDNDYEECWKCTRCNKGIIYKGKHSG